MQEIKFAHFTVKKTNLEEYVPILDKNRDLLRGGAVLELACEKWALKQGITHPFEYTCEIVSEIPKEWVYEKVYQISREIHEISQLMNIYAAARFVQMKKENGE